MPIHAHPSKLYEDFPALKRPQTHNDYEERLDAQNPYEIDVQKYSPNTDSEYTTIRFAAFPFGQ